jgi:hypothetical protein
VFAALHVPGSDTPLVAAGVSIVAYGLTALVLLRFGLLSVMSAVLISQLVIEPTLNGSAWYFTNVTLVVAGLIALEVWACIVSMGGRRLWKQDLFG